MKLNDKLPKFMRKEEPISREEERRLLAIVGSGEMAERLLENPAYQQIFLPIVQTYRDRKIKECYNSTEPLTKNQLLGNAQAVDELQTEISNIIQSGKKAALELKTKRT